VIIDVVVSLICPPIETPALRKDHGLRAAAEAVRAEAVAGAAVGQQVAVPAAVVVDNALRGAGGEPGGPAAGADEGRHRDQRAAALARDYHHFRRRATSTARHRRRRGFAGVGVSTCTHAAYNTAIKMHNLISVR
jgi:hypothetical protein